MKRSEAVKELRGILRDPVGIEEAIGPYEASMLRQIASALERDEWEPEEGAKAPTVLEVTPEGRVIYDPNSVMSCDAARKHLDSLRKKTVPPLPPTAREKIKKALWQVEQMKLGLRPSSLEYADALEIARLLTEALDAPSGAVPPPTRVSNSIATEEAPEGRTIQPLDPATAPLTDHEIHPLPGRYEP